MRKIVSKQDKENMIRLREKGWTYSEIAKIIGFNINTVYAHLNPEFKARLSEKNEGWKNKNKESLREYRKEYGLKYRQKYKKKINKINALKYKRDKKYFVEYRLKNKRLHLIQNRFRNKGIIINRREIRAYLEYNEN